MDVPAYHVQRWHRGLRFHGGKCLGSIIRADTQNKGSDCSWSEFHHGRHKLFRLNKKPDRNGRVGREKFTTKAGTRESLRWARVVHQSKPHLQKPTSSPTLKPTKVYVRRFNLSVLDAKFVRNGLIRMQQSCIDLRQSVFCDWFHCVSHVFPKGETDEPPLLFIGSLVVSTGKGHNALSFIVSWQDLPFYFPSHDRALAGT